jgi:hypothetical protein
LQQDQEKETFYFWLCIISGHDFSRAVKAQTGWALAPVLFSGQIRRAAGLLLEPPELAFGAGVAWQGLKQDVFPIVYARLKSCPDTKQETQDREVFFSTSFASTQKM